MVGRGGTSRLSSFKAWQSRRWSWVSSSILHLVVLQKEGSHLLQRDQSLALVPLESLMEGWWDFWHTIMALSFTSISWDRVCGRENTWTSRSFEISSFIFVTRVSFIRKIHLNIHIRQDRQDSFILLTWGVETVTLWPNCLSILIFNFSPLFDWSGLKPTGVVRSPSCYCFWHTY